MVRRAVAFGFILLLVLSAGGCSRNESDEAGDRTGAAAGKQQEPTEAARSRGISAADRGPEQRPRIESESVDLVWQESPERGIRVEVTLSNAVETELARAKGYVFLIARSVADPEAVGVYPWSARLVDGRPDRAGDGTRVSFLEKERIRAFIPFSGEEGQYDSVTLFVYDLDGGLIIEEIYRVRSTEGMSPEDEGALAL